MFDTDAPRPLTGSIAAVQDGRVVLFGGADRDRNVHDGGWETLPDGPSISLRSLSFAPDAVHGAPAGRANVGVSYNGDLFAFFGGTDDGGSTLSDVTTWALAPGPAWSMRMLATGATAPEPRAGAAFFDSVTCNGELGVFAGSTATGLTNSVSFLDCTAGCTWSTPALSGTAPSARRDTVLLPSSLGVIVIGGQTSSGPVMDAARLNECAGTWTPFTLAGDVPGPRSGHTLSNIYLFGGRTAGGYANDVYTVSADLTASVLTFASLDVAVDGDGSPAGRAGHAAALDGEARLILYGGNRGRPLGVSRDRVLGDLWSLRFF